MDPVWTRRVEEAAVAIQAAARGRTARAQILQCWKAYRECFPDDRVEHLRLLRETREPLGQGPDVFVARNANPYDV